MDFFLARGGRARCWQLASWSFLEGEGREGISLEPRRELGHVLSAHLGNTVCKSERKFTGIVQSAILIFVIFFRRGMHLA